MAHDTMTASLRSVQAWLNSRTDSEHEQALVRIIVIALVLGYMAVFHGWRAHWAWTAHNIAVLQVLGSFLLFAIALLFAIFIYPQASPVRRVLGVLADIGAVTWYMAIAGQFGFIAVGVFLFIILGNGFRYGRGYLYLSQALSVLGMTWVLWTVSFWADLRAGGFGLLVTVLVIPLYISALLAALERQARGVR